MNEKHTDQEFIEYIVKSLVTHPEEVVVERKVDEMGVLLTLKVNPEDMGLVIGKRGSTAGAIRTLAWIIGLKNHAYVNFKIAEPEGSTHSKTSGLTLSGVEGSMRPVRKSMESVVDELKS